MDRINHVSAEADKFGAGKDGFTDGSPTDPSSGTVVNEGFLDGVQEEIVGVIEASGLTPSDADYTQLLTAINSRIAPTRIAQTLVDTTTSPFGTDIWTSTFAWEPTQEKFYASIIETASLDMKAYESVDGVTWSGGTTVNLNDTAIFGPAEVAYCPDNDKIGVATEGSFHLSSTNAVAGFSTTPTDTMPYVGQASGLVWDDTNNLWICCGADGTQFNGGIDTDVAAGTTWTNRNQQGAMNAVSMANNGNGTTVVNYSSTERIYFSTNGTTWTRMSFGPSITFGSVHWCGFAGLFFATGSTPHWSADGDVWTAAPFPVVNSPSVTVCDNFMVYTDAATDEMWFVGSAAAIKGDAPLIGMNIDTSPNNLSHLIQGRPAGSGNTFVYLNLNETLVVSEFGL